VCLSCTITDICSSEYWHDLEIYVMGYSLEVIEKGTTRKLGYSFLFTFRSNYGHIFSHFFTIDKCDGQTPHDCIDHTYAWHHVAKVMALKFNLAVEII